MDIIHQLLKAFVLFRAIVWGKERWIWGGCLRLCLVRAWNPGGIPSYSGFANKQFANFRRRHRKPRKTIQKKLRVLKVSLSSTSAGTVMSVDSLSTAVPASPSSLYRFQQSLPSVAEPLPPLFDQALSILFDWSSESDAAHETSACW